MKKIPLIFALLYLVISPSFSSGLYDIFDEKRILEFIVLTLTSITFMIIKSKYDLNIDQKIKGAFVILFILWVISAINAKLISWSILEICWYLLLIQLIYYSAYIYTFDTSQARRLLLIAIFSMVLIYESRVIADYVIGLIRSDWTTWPRQRDVVMMYKGVNINPSGFLNFRHVRFFNHLQTWSLPLLVFGFSYYRDDMIKPLRTVVFIIICFWWTLVFAADARGTMLASFLSIFIGLYITKSIKSDYFKTYFISCVLGLGIYIVLFLLPENEAKEVLTRFGDSGRFNAWLFSIKLIVDNPLLGLGPMHFSHADLDFQLSTPHNLFFQVGSEWGLPATIIFFVITLFCYSKYYSLTNESFKNDNTNYFRLAIFMSLTAALIHSMFSGIYNSQLSQIFGSLIIGIAISDYYLESNNALFLKADSFGFGKTLIVIIIAANLIFVSYKVLNDIPKLEDRKIEYAERYNALRLLPRFWVQGIIYED
ncbi:O-antigen ligase family protein [Balneola sp. MJW-20]|uniref:O-antigen ligase family protein n=1 Tax=Gracilimonas aurantiaca TaxID=3234185 RepID=UPI0034678791